MSNYSKDALIWIVVVTMGAMAGASLLLRDANNGFGAVTYGAVPSFELTDQFGDSFSLVDLSDIVWVGSFISPHCENDQSCQDLIQMTVSIYQQLKDDPKISMVSMLIHSETSSPKSILTKSDVQPERWKILKGSPQTIESLATACIQKKLPASGYDNRLFLVDQNGIIRGYYQANKLDEVRKLVKDIRKLA